MTRERVLEYGPGAALIETSRDTIAMAQALLDTGRFREVVPAERSVLVMLRPGTAVADIEGIVEGLPPELPLVEGRDIEIPTIYDGPDLAFVADATGCSVDEVIALHAGVVYHAAFAGFAPGYVYCTGLDPRLRLPRRATPRTRVPAGSVAIADLYTAVYPQASPGGWHLLGTTHLELFDITRSEPSLIRPGDRVHFTVRTA